MKNYEGEEFRTRPFAFTDLDFEFCKFIPSYDSQLCHSLLHPFAKLQ